VLRAATVSEMRGFARTVGVERAADLDEFLDLFDARRTCSSRDP
jgi:hypothetical protein